MFTWKPIYSEIAHKLPEFESENHRLVELMVRMHEEGLKVSKVKDIDANDQSLQLEEIDPFSFMANFNRSVTNDNRIAIVRRQLDFRISDN